MRFWSITLLALVGWFVVGPESALAECSSHYVPRHLIISGGSGPALIHSTAPETWRWPM